MQRIVRTATLVCGFAAIFLDAVTFAQDMPLPLKPGTVKVVPGLSSGAFLLPTKCDEDGFLYYRRLLRRDAPLAPVIRISPDGKKYTEFRFDNLPGETLKDIGIVDYMPFSSKVYMLGYNGEGKPLVLRYNAEGKYEEITWLEGNIQPSRFGVFPDGSFVVFGTRTARRDESTVSGEKPPAYQAAIVLFGAAGKYIKDLSSAAPEEWNHLSESKTEKLDSISLAITDSTPNGTYLMPYTAKPELIALSSSGEITNRLKLWSPGEGYLPMHLRVGPAQFLIEFSKPGDAAQGAEDRFVVYSLTSGERLFHFMGNEEVTGSFGCYDWKGNFTFLTSRSGQRAILEASTR